MKKVLTNFSIYSDGAFESKVHTILQNMNANPNFPNPVPALAVITTQSADYSAALVKANSGDRAEIAAKNELRQGLEESLTTLGRYINFTANGDVTKLLTSGYEVSKDPEPTIITKPENIVVENGLAPGTLNISVKRIKGARVYLHEYTTDETLKPESWVQTISTTAKFTFSNLQSGTRYYCRVGAAGPYGQLLYSDVISQIAL